MIPYDFTFVAMVSHNLKPYETFLKSYHYYQHTSYQHDGFDTNHRAFLCIEIYIMLRYNVSTKFKLCGVN